MRNTRHRSRNVLATACVLIVLLALRASASTAPSDPNNAALLYYQAIMACPQADDAIGSVLDKVIAGAKPNEGARKYVAECTQAIRFVEAAVKTPACDWGITDSSGKSLFGGSAVKVHTLALVLGAEASIHASDGNYPTALVRCVLMRHVAKHGGGRQFNPLASAFDEIACRVVRQVLGLMPPDADTLTWLRRELVATRFTPPDFARTLQADIEFILQSAAGNRRMIAQLREGILKHADESMKAQIERMSDEQILDLVRQSHVGFLAEVRQIVGSSLPYRDVYAQLEKLEQKIAEGGKDNPSVALLSITSMRGMARIYTGRVRRQAYSNALDVALELYIDAAKTGRMPGRLSSDWPRDPLTGEDFDYEITKTGFTLRSRNRDIPGDYGVELELRVADPSLLRRPEPYGP